MIFRETSFRESDCPGNVLSGKRLSGKMTIRETSFRESSFRESDFPGNVRKPLAWIEFGESSTLYCFFSKRQRHMLHSTKTHLTQAVGTWKHWLTHSTFDLPQVWLAQAVIQAFLLKPGLLSNHTGFVGQDQNMGPTWLVYGSQWYDDSNRGPPSLDILAQPFSHDTVTDFRWHWVTW